MRCRLIYIVPAVLLFLCMHARAATAQPSSDSLSWEHDCKLSWDDFQGTHKELTIFGAQTFTTIRYKLYKSDTGFHVDVRCVFLKKVSWRLPDASTPYTLQHEQGHFDISELYTRMLRKAFSEYRYSRHTVNADIAAIFNDLCAQKAAFNSRYDKETIHALDKERQAQWDLKIALLLDGLKEYASD